MITSTWRLEQSYEDLLRRFSPDIAAMVEGVTPRYRDLTNVPNTLVGYEREQSAEDRKTLVEALTEAGYPPA